MMMMMMMMMIMMTDKNLQLLPGHPSAINLQKITLNSTAHFIRKVLG